MNKNPKLNENPKPRWEILVKSGSCMYFLVDLINCLMCSDE